MTPERERQKVQAAELIKNTELRKQAAKEVLNQRYADVSGCIECVLVGKCPYCKTWIVDEGENSCPKCWQAVKWKE